jgi:hypothetical protein
MEGYLYFIRLFRNPKNYSPFSLRTQRSGNRGNTSPRRIGRRGGELPGIYFSFFGSWVVWFKKTCFPPQPFMVEFPTSAPCQKTNVTGSACHPERR